MQWWNDFLDWFNSTEGMRVITTAVLPFIAIIIAGVVAALVARGAITRLLAKQDRAHRASAVEALIAVGEKASQWSGLSNQTREHFEAQASVASIRVRLVPAPGAAMASAWAEYQLAEIKRNSANFSVQADQGFAEYRDRLIEWHHRPARARKLFVQDLDRFRLESASDDTDLIERQRRWKAEQSAPATVATPAAAPTQAPARPGASAAPKFEASVAQPTTPIVPAASTRNFSPTTSSATTPASSTAGSPLGSTAATTGSNEVIEATIDDDAKSEPSRTV